MTDVFCVVRSQQGNKDPSVHYSYKTKLLRRHLFFCTKTLIASVRFTLGARLRSD